MPGNACTVLVSKLPCSTNAKHGYFVQWKHDANRGLARERAGIRTAITLHTAVELLVDDGAIERGTSKQRSEETYHLDCEGEEPDIERLLAVLAHQVLGGVAV